MSYQVIVPKSVQKQLDKLPGGSIADSVLRHILLLRENPRPAGCIKLHASDGWRIRVGEYRVVFDIDDDKKMVVLRKVGHRREIYRS